jgi:hypothetical protein
MGIPNRYERRILPRGQQLEFQAVFTLSHVAEVKNLWSLTSSSFGEYM